MKIRNQTLIFARQVQGDLLALSDPDLCQTMLIWMNGEPAEPAPEGVEAVQSLLGFTLKSAKVDVLTQGKRVESLREARGQWIAPTPQQLRTLLTEMDVQRFASSVLPLAFQALHEMHSEWGEGATFNAHLANHLRWIAKKHQDLHREQGTLQPRRQ